MTSAEQLQLAIDHHRAGRIADAGNVYLRILADEPGNPAALHMLGVVLCATDQLERARAILLRAETRQAPSAELHSNIGIVLQQLGELDAALSRFDSAVALNPGFAAAWSNRGLALQQMRRFSESLDSFDRATALDPMADDVRWHAALNHLHLGDFARGWVEYEWRWNRALQPAPGTEGPRWSGVEPVAGRVVLLHTEQGYGDTLQFCRYAPMVAALGATVVLAVQAPLVRLLQSLPGVARVVDIAQALPPFDLQCPLLSLPLAFGTELDTIPADSPYLQADPQAVAHWSGRLAALPGRRIGLVWSGAARPEMPAANQIDQRRSMRLANLAPLAGVPGVSFVSLQKGKQAAEARHPPQGMVLHDWTGDLHDFADTAALVAGLDLLITVDTAMAHLGAALAVPVWVLNRHDRCWRWLSERTDSPWYPTMRLFTQDRPGNWPGVVAELVRALRDG